MEENKIDYEKAFKDLVGCFAVDFYNSIYFADGYDRYIDLDIEPETKTLMVEFLSDGRIDPGTH